MTDESRDPAASLGSVSDAITELRRLRSDAQGNRDKSGWWPVIAGSKWDGFVQGIDACIGRLEMANASPSANVALTHEEDEPVTEASPTFELELCDLINRHDMERFSNTPDWVLALMLVRMLDAYASATHWVRPCGR